MIRTGVKNLNITDLWLATRVPALSYEASILEKIIVFLGKTTTMIYLIYYYRDRVDTGYLVYYSRDRLDTGYLVYYNRNRHNTG